MRRKTKQNDEKKSPETRCAKKTKKFLFSFLAFYHRPEQCAAEFLAGRPFKTVLTGFCKFSTRRLSAKPGKYDSKLPTLRVLEFGFKSNPLHRIETRPRTQFLFKRVPIMFGS